MRSFIIVLLIGGAIAAFIYFSNPRVSGAPTSGPLITARSQLRQLALSAKFYADEHAGSFPQPLLQLSESKYLSEKDYKKLTDRIQIDYFPPTSVPSEKVLILVGHIPEYVVYAFSTADVEDRKLK